MARMDDLIGSLTDEDGIRPDFVDAVREAYDEDLSVSITRVGELEGELADAAAAAELAASTHKGEIDALKASFFDKIQSGNVVTEVVADVVEPEVEASFYEEND